MPPPTAKPKTPRPNPPEPTNAPTPRSAAPEIRRGGTAPAPAIVLIGTEGSGKTTAGAYAPDPVFLMARNETGLLTLREHGRVPDVPHFAERQSWSETLSAVDFLATNGASYKTIVLDAMGGFERLCHEHVCVKEFGGDWGEKGFMSYHKGYDMSITPWLDLLTRLDKLRRQGKTVLLICHSKIQQFKNPIGPDFDRYTSDCHAKTWGVTHRWADAVLFLNFLTIVQEEKDRRKRGIGGTDRILYTQHNDAWDAKNRFGMEPELIMPAEPAEMWAAIESAIRGEQTP